MNTRLNRLHRLLLNPDAADPSGGTPPPPHAADPSGGTPPPPPAPATPAAAQPPAAPPAPAQAVMIQVSPDEYASLIRAKDRVAEIESAKARELAAKEQERLDALVREGKANEALASVQQQRETEVTSLRNQLDSQRVEMEIVRNTMTTPWASDAAGRQAQQLLAAECEVVTENGVPTVRHKPTGQPLAAVVKTRLDSPDYLHFRAPTSKGGPGPVNPNTPPPPAQEGPTNPVLAQAVAARQLRNNGNGAIGLVPQY